MTALTHSLLSCRVGAYPCYNFGAREGLRFQNFLEKNVILLILESVDAMTKTFSGTVRSWHSPLQRICIKSPPYKWPDSPKVLHRR
jgi:hypothetical protein